MLIVSIKYLFKYVQITTSNKSLFKAYKRATLSKNYLSQTEPVEPKFTYKLCFTNFKIIGIKCFLDT